MYILKKEIQEQIRPYGTNRKLAKISGISPDFISEIFGGRCIKEKKCAFAFTKAIDKDLEIQDIFEIL